MKNQHKLSINLNSLKNMKEQTNQNDSFLMPPPLSTRTSNKSFKNFLNHKRENSTQVSITTRNNYITSSITSFFFYNPESRNPHSALQYEQVKKEKLIEKKKEFKKFLTT